MGTETPIKSRYNLLILLQMKKQEELLEKFQVEELEKRYEMRSWRERWTDIGHPIIGELGE